MKKKRVRAGIVASRALVEVGTGRVARVKIARPTRSGREWECRFFITGAGNKAAGAGHGIDAVQALFQALGAVRQVLDKAKQRFSWLDGEPASAGFPRFVPEFFGVPFSEKIEKMIDREVEIFAKAAEAKARS